MKNLCRKAAAFLLAAILMLSMAACNGGFEETKATEPVTGEVTEGVTENAANDTKVKMTLCLEQMDDHSFYQSAYEGATRIKEELGESFEVNVMEMGEEKAAWGAAIREAAKSGADIIVSAGFENKENFETIPPEYPDVKFILFDQDVDGSSGNLNNVLTVLFDYKQAGFLAGAVAAYYTTGEYAANTDKTIGFVGGAESEEIKRVLAGYEAGAKYVDPEIKILSEFVGDFTDISRAKELANGEISEGADIIFHAAGAAGTGVFEAVSIKDGVMAIGADSDQYEALEGSKLQESIITSGLKRLDTALFKIGSDYAADPSSVPFGSTITYGLAEDAVGIVFNDNLTKNIGEENVLEVKEILEQMKSGEITQ